MSLAVATRYMGETPVPQDVKRRRRQVYDMMRRFGTPVIVKHMFNADDVQDGTAEPTMNFDVAYGQSRRDDPLSWGVGYCSVEKSTTEWIAQDGSIVTNADLLLPSPSLYPDPQAYIASLPQGYLPAPKYRGFGQGYLTWVIMPDVKEDVFKMDKGGALIKVQNAQAQAPWYPKMADNDLLITVELDNKGEVVKTVDRYQLKMANPITMRGRDKRGRTETRDIGGNRYVVNQIFELAKVPTNDVLYNVETDR